MWSQRDNNNYEETALLTTLNYFAQNGKLFLNNYYLKSKRSIQKPEQNGPAAYVLSADEVSPSRQAMLLRVLHDQHVEVQQTTAPVTVQLPQKAADEDKHDEAADAKAAKPKPPASQTFPAGSYIIRMDQPYSRIADALLDRQFWSPADPQKHPYDDTGWSLGPLFGVDTTRILDGAILKAPMHLVDPTIPSSSRITPIRRSSHCAINSRRPTSSRRPPPSLRAGNPIRPARGSCALSPPPTWKKSPRHCTSRSWLPQT
jgi:hypothetical protein